jgi:D-glycero-alpha-D-manno-heptose-7-phosphate kinase
VTGAAIDHEVIESLEEGLCLFFTGYTRSASAILKHQDDKSKAKDGSMIDNLHYIKHLGKRSHQALLQGDLVRFAALMDEHWQQKKKRSDEMSNSRIDELYTTAMRNGALGGKLIGAGGGGFLMFYTENKRRLLHAMLEQGLENVRFRFDFEGSKTMIQ